MNLDAKTWGFVSIVLTSAATATTWYVPDDYASIQGAIDAAQGGDEVVVRMGVYVEHLDFRGKAVTVRSTRPDNPNTVDRTVVNAQRADHAVAFVSGESAESRLDGLTITGGASGDGGGIYIVSSAPTIAHCVIMGNVAEGAGETYGGGVYVYSGQPVFSNCEISRNDATHGGGLNARGSSAIVMHDCDVTWNSSLHGGGVFVGNNSTAELLRCRITDNTASHGGGGGVQIRDAVGAIRNCIVARNGAGRYGGGIWLYNSDTEVINCVITMNFAPYDGGAIYCDAGSRPVIKNSILNSNWPGQIHVNSGEPVVTYCDVRGGWPGTGNFDASPTYGIWRGFEYVLLPGSPCIDAGDPNIADGHKWPDWYENSGERSDVGAYGGPGARGWLLQE